MAGTGNGKKKNNAKIAGGKKQDAKKELVENKGAVKQQAEQTVTQGDKAADLGNTVEKEATKKVDPSVPTSNAPSSSNATEPPPIFNFGRIGDQAPTFNFVAGEVHGDGKGKQPMMTVDDIKFFPGERKTLAPVSPSAIIASARAAKTAVPGEMSPAVAPGHSDSVKISELSSRLSMQNIKHEREMEQQRINHKRDMKELKEKVDEQAAQTKTLFEKLNEELSRNREERKTSEAKIANLERRAESSKRAEILFKEKIRETEAFYNEAKQRNSTLEEENLNLRVQLERSEEERRKLAADIDKQSADKREAVTQTDQEPARLPASTAKADLVPAPIVAQMLNAVTQTEQELTSPLPATSQTDINPAAVNPPAGIGILWKSLKYLLVLAIFLIICGFCVIVVKNHLPSGMAEGMVTIKPTRTIKVATRTRSFLPETGHPYHF